MRAGNILHPMANVIHFKGNEQHPHGSPTLLAFLRDTTSDVKLIQGPVESGKSGACMAQIYIWMCQMPRSLDGIRRSRFLIVRPTYGELLTSVIRDFLEWFPEDQYGKFKSTEPYSYKMKFLDVECTVDFVSYADTQPDTLKKLRSTQYTAAWVNEGQFTPLKLFTEIIRRTGRYPSKKMCPDYDRRKRAVLDNNAPLTHDHWILYMRGDTPIPDDIPEDQRMAYDKPDNWEFFVQPPALLEVRNEKGEIVDYKLNPDAENLQNMGEKPYSEWGGMTRDEIDRDFRNITRENKGNAARYPNFIREIHVAKRELTPYEGAPIEIGVDPGQNPGFTMGQKVDGRVYFLHAEELMNVEAVDLADRIKAILNKRFRFYKDTGLVITGDPAGGWGQLNTRTTTKQIFAAAGLPYEFQSRKDNPDLRWSTGRSILNQMVNGEPKLLLCPVNCRQLIAAWDGGMQMKDGKLDKKSLNANVGESAEYLLWGMGEAKDVVKRPEGSTPKGPFKTAEGSGNVFYLPHRNKRRKEGLFKTA